MEHSILSRQTLFLTLGYSGAGKSYMSRQLAESLNLVRISADRIRYELFENPTYSRDEDAIVFRILDYMLEEALKSGSSVICDADFGLRKSRRIKYELARKYQAACVVLWVQTDIDTAFQRTHNRDGRRIDDKYSSSIDRDTFDRLISKLKKPDKEPVIVVSGKHVFKIQFTNILRKLQQADLLQKPPQQPSAVSQTIQQGPTRKPILERRPQRNQQSLRIDPKS